MPKNAAPNDFVKFIKDLWHEMPVSSVFLAAYAPVLISGFLIKKHFTDKYIRAREAVVYPIRDDIDAKLGRLYTPGEDGAGISVALSAFSKSTGYRVTKYDDQTGPRRCTDQG